MSHFVIKINVDVDKDSIAEVEALRDKIEEHLQSLNGRSIKTQVSLYELRD